MSPGPGEGPHCMTFASVLAQSTVSDLDAAERWYGLLWDRPPDARPMPGLLEWRLPGGSGLQVWSEPDRAGRSTVVLATGDLDALATRLRAAGVAAEEPQPGGGGRVLVLADPDGNRVVLSDS
jgi:catechol 2,3-dioxygenase-like lactoylglutathione lyase family enzyme